MNQDNIPYQNREIGEINPLLRSQEIDLPVDTKTSKPPLSPKIIILIILGAIIVLLLIISLIISLVNHSPKTASPSKPTPSSSFTESPTDIPNSAIPTEFREKFDQIDQNNQTDLNFNPPQIDPNIGQ
jgi:hypothetical protein